MKTKGSATSIGNVNRKRERQNLMDTPAQAKGNCKESWVEVPNFTASRRHMLTLWHEEGVSVNTIRIRLGHESLDVTLTYLKAKDAESQEAQEHADSTMAAYA